LLIFEIQLSNIHIHVGCLLNADEIVFIQQQRKHITFQTKSR